MNIPQFTTVILAEGQIFADAVFDRVTMGINVSTETINTDKTFLLLDTILLLNNRCSKQYHMTRLN